jgi:hypothetical protein
MEQAIINKFGQGILWSKDIENIDLQRDKIYIIHQVLSFGQINQIKQLFKIYKSQEIIDVFVNHPKRIYTPAVFNFVKNFILNLKEKNLPKNKYVKTPF